MGAPSVRQDWSGGLDASLPQLASVTLGSPRRGSGPDRISPGAILQVLGRVPAQSIWRGRGTRGASGSMNRPVADVQTGVIARPRRTAEAELGQGLAPKVCCRALRHSVEDRLGAREMNGSAVYHVT